MKNGKIKQYNLGIFCPSSFKDFNILADLLDENIEKICAISTNNSGEELAAKYAKERGLSLFYFPITRHCNVFCSNAHIIRVSDFVWIFDNGNSKNKDKIIEECKAQDVKYKVVKVPEPDALDKALLKNCKQMIKLYDQYLKEQEEAAENNFLLDFTTYLGNSNKETEKLEKIIIKIKNIIE